MIKSKNNFFYKPLNELLALKYDLLTLLKIKKRSEEDIKDYLKAYDYFMKNPNNYDGATIVQDLRDIDALDIDAMLHDYEYIHGANKNFILKWNSDLRYIQNMQRNGKGLRIIRLTALTIIGIIYVPYNLIIK